jgi:ElaB/YqjD/DUF883 family membrane-anchored ribosome-binding protein
MHPVLLATGNWLDSHQYLALWIEGIALLLIFIWDRWDSHQQHKETLAQMDGMRRQAELIAGQNELLKESVAVAKDGAEAARANAQAAVLNAQAVINSERPWIVVSVRQKSVGSYIFTATNTGRTPAVFESGTLIFTYDSYPDSLPSNPHSGSPITPDRTLIVQGDAFDLHPAGVNPVSMIKDAQMSEIVKRGSQFLVFYGWIIYKDVFSRDGEEAGRHETRFCYRFDLSSGTFVRTEQEEYNRYT